MKWFFLFYTKKIERQIGVVFFRIMSERDFNFTQLQVSSVSSTEEEQKQPPEVFFKKGVKDILTKFTGKNLRQSLRPATLLKERLCTGVFL